MKVFFLFESEFRIFKYKILQQHYTAKTFFQRSTANLLFIRVNLGLILSQ